MMRWFSALRAACASARVLNLMIAWLGLRMICEEMIPYFENICLKSRTVVFAVFKLSIMRLKPDDDDDDEG